MTADLKCSRAGPDGDLSVDAVWPYWMDRPVNPSSQVPGSSHKSIPDEPDPSGSGAADKIAFSHTVMNDVRLEQNIMLLTGANMSGKSTLMRSIMAVALLGNLGLPVPCMHATIPQVGFRSEKPPSQAHCET